MSVGGGVAYGNMGYSHHAIQDIALMRTLPNTTIYAPVDANETSNCFKSIIKNTSPSYLRLHKAGEELITSADRAITHGKPMYVSGNPAAKRVLLTTGFCGQGASDYVQRHDDYSHYTLPAWGLRHKEHIASFAEQFDEIVIIEDHLIDAGFCSWILESLIGTTSIQKVKSKAMLTKTIGLVGSEDYLHKASKLFDL